MSKITFTMKNEAGEDVLYSSKEITTRDYRDYLVLNDSLTSDKTEVEKLDQQLGFIASLFENVTVEQLLEHTDFAKSLKYSQKFMLILWVMWTQRGKNRS